MELAKLTTLTPVHVGSGEKLLRDFDFIIKDGKVGFLDLEKVVEKIGIDRLPQLTAEIEKKNVKSFLEKVLPNVSIDDICIRVASHKAIGSNCNELKAQYHVSLLNACIPGSSIKGAIKTTIWETLATKEKQKSWRTEDYKNRKGKFDSGIIDNRLFGPNANEKTTRFLKIGDVHFPETKTSVYEIGILNAGYNDWEFKRGSSFLAECIPSGQTGQFNFKIDKDWLEKNKRVHPEKWRNLSTTFIENDVVSFCTQLNAYISRQVGYELDDLNDEGFRNHEQGEEMLNELKRIKGISDKAIQERSKFFILRVGGNNGWNFTTGGWVKSSTLPDSEYNAMRKTIQRGNTYDMDLWPKTRKLTTSGLPLGFVKIEF